MVITFNGWNDSNISWDYQTYYSRYDRHFERAFHPRLINGSILAECAHRRLPNTLALAQKASSFLGWQTTSLDSFKKAYLPRSKQFNGFLVERAYPERQRVFLSSIRSIIDIAKSRNADVIVTQIPVMMAAKKPFVGFEKSYWAARSLTAYALPERDVKNMRSVDRFAYEQLRQGHQMFDTTAFGLWYGETNKRLRELAAAKAVGYVDLQSALDKKEHAAKALFISHAHLSVEGLEILAKEIAATISARTPN
jgi:hypothetical protein